MTITTIKPTSVNNQAPYYEHQINTPTIEVYLCNNSASDGIDKTYVQIKLPSGDVVTVNQVKGVVSVGDLSINIPDNK